jgi:hypothetical protein
MRRLLRQYGVKVGVSLDGDAVANDLHRRYADGRSSHHLGGGRVTRPRGILLITINRIGWADHSSAIALSQIRDTL